FLDMFRVVNFVGLPVNSEMLQRLHDGTLDLPQLLAEQVQVLQKPEAPVTYPTAAQAGSAAGLHVYLPSWMPVGWDTGTPLVEVLGARSARATANTARLQQILTSLDINDVSIPQGLDGRSATIRIPPAVAVRWHRDGQTLELLQSRSPQVDLPPG